MNSVQSNRDRFFEIIKPIFHESNYDILKATEGKYQDKIIKAFNHKTGSNDFDIWCHTRNDRLDLFICEYRANQIPYSLGLKEKCHNIKNGDKLNSQPAISFQEIDEDTLIQVLNFLATGSASKTIAPNDINSPIPPKATSEDGFVVICPRCDNKFKHSERCPECGQLILY